MWIEPWRTTTCVIIERRKRATFRIITGGGYGPGYMRIPPLNFQKIRGGGRKLLIGKLVYTLLIMKTFNKDT